MLISTNQTKIALIILAAGASKRMGKPKQLLKWGNSTLLGHAIDRAMKSEAREVFVVLGANYDKIKNAIKQDQFTILKNGDWERGIGNSIAHGIKSIQKFDFDGVLLMLADQPQVDTSFLNDLIAEFQKKRHTIIATKYQKWAGVPAIFDKSYFTQLTSLTGEKGGKQLINDEPTHVAMLKPQEPITDIDTIQVYQQLYDISYPNPKIPQYEANKHAARQEMKP